MGFTKICDKKNAAKKLGEIYGIDVKFIDEKGNNINVNKYIPEYITASIDTEHLNMEIKGEEIVKESTSSKVGNALKVTGEASTYIGGSVAVGSGILKAATTVVEATETATTAAVGIGSTALKVVGTGLIFVGAIVGVALGGYFTTKYCEGLIDKFEDYYKKNAHNIENSYKQASDYLLERFVNLS